MFPLMQYVGFPFSSVTEFGYREYEVPDGCAFSNQDGISADFLNLPILVVKQSLTGWCGGGCRDGMTSNLEAVLSYLVRYF